MASQIVRLNTVGVFPLGLFEEKVYSNGPQTIHQLKENIINAIGIEEIE